jgi:aspartokinase
VAADFASGVQDVADVRSHGDRTVLAAVANTIADSPRAMDDLVTALDGLTIHALARTPTTHSVIAVLDDADLQDAMERLHDRYALSFRALEAPADDATPSDDNALARASS